MNFIITSCWNYSDEIHCFVVTTAEDVKVCVAFHNWVGILNNIFYLKITVTMMYVVYAIPLTAKGHWQAE